LYNEIRQENIHYRQSGYRLTPGSKSWIPTIKVSATSRTSAVAGAIAGIFREREFVNVQAIGASAVNQAVKALALARNYLAEDGYDIVSIPEFVDVEIDGNIRTAIRLSVFCR